MAFPAFFEQAPTIRLHDGLAALLGASDDGLIDYHYADAVRLAGHSCPTVAGAWLCARAGIQHLFAGETPERGAIRVHMDDAEDAGVTGVIAQVLTLVTGAAGPNGFKGLGGQYARNNLLSYDAGSVRGMRFERSDTGSAVDVNLDASPVPPAPEQRQLIPLVMSGQADADQRREFGRLWQERVKTMLLQHADDPAMIQLRSVA